MIRINNQKECPVCGETYDASHNYCSHHDEAIELVYTMDLVKACPKCGRKFKMDDNFCSQHEDELVKLVHINSLVKQCSSCGAKYPEDYNYCVRCNSDEELVNIIEPVDIKDIQTHPNEFYTHEDYSNNYDEINDLFLQSNIDKLNDFNLTEAQFDNILDNIKKTQENILNKLMQEHNIDLNALTTLEKILLFSKSFVKTDYKEGGGDLGHFEFNEIYIDDRANNAIQITTIIHELSHFLMAEILEQIVSLLLNTNKTDAVEAFVCYTLVYDNFNYLVDEYCAHTVEGRFAVLGYQDYGSYKSVLSNFLREYSEEHVEVANITGNTFAKHIKDIITTFIDEKLRQDIKEEFTKINDVPKYSELQYETSQVFKWDNFSKAIKLMLTQNIENIKNNPQDMEKLKLYAVKFRKNNQR